MVQFQSAGHKLDTTELVHQGIFVYMSLLSHHQSQHHEDEKHALSREIIVLNNHLMEAKLTIEKLQEDNVRHFVILNDAPSEHTLRQLILIQKCVVAVRLQDLYRKDCNLAAQLLHCNKSLYRAQLSKVNNLICQYLSSSVLIMCDNILKSWDQNNGNGSLKIGISYSTCSQY